MRGKAYHVKDCASLFLPPSSQILSGGGGCSDEGLGLSCAPVGGPEHLLLPGTLFVSAQGESQASSSSLFSSFTALLPL